MPEFDFCNYYNLNKISLFSQSNAECVFPIKYPLTLVDRERFDYELLTACKNAGVHILEGTTFSQFIPSQNTLILNDGTELSYGILVAADGIFSPIRKALGIADIQKGFCIQNIINKSQCSLPLVNLDKVCFDFAHIAFGYNWILPNERNIIIGTGVLAENETYRHALTEHQKLCDHLGISDSTNRKEPFYQSATSLNSQSIPMKILYWLAMRLVSLIQLQARVYIMRCYQAITPVLLTNRISFIIGVLILRCFLHLQIQSRK